MKVLNLVINQKVAQNYVTSSKKFKIENRIYISHICFSCFYIVLSCTRSISTDQFIILLLTVVTVYIVEIYCEKRED